MSRFVIVVMLVCLSSVAGENHVKRKGMAGVVAGLNDTPKDPLLTEIAPDKFKGGTKELEGNYYSGDIGELIDPSSTTLDTSSKNNTTKHGTYTERLRNESDRLRKQYELLKARQDETERAAAEGLRDRSKRFNERWRPIIEAMRENPDKVRSDEWRNMLGAAIKDFREDPTRGGSPAVDSPPPTSDTTPTRVFDENGDEVPPDDLDYEYYLAEARQRETEAAAEAKTDPTSPAEKTPVKTESPLDQVSDAITNDTRPTGMNPDDWRVLRGTYLNDRAELLGAFGNAIRERNEREWDTRERSDLAALLEKTNKELGRVTALRDKFTPDELDYIERIMRDRMRQLAKMMGDERERMRQLLADERAGKPLNREEWKQYGAIGGAWGKVTQRFTKAFGPVIGGAWAKATERLNEALGQPDPQPDTQPDTQGHGLPPALLTGDPSDAAVAEANAGKSDHTNSDTPSSAEPDDAGLPFPEWMEVDPNSDGYKALALSQLLQAQRNIAIQEQALQRVEAAVLSSDKARYRAVGNRLLFEDRRHDRIGSKIAADRRRVLLKKYKSKLDSNRPQRTEAKRDEIQIRIEYWKKEAAAQQQRLKEMAQAEADPGIEKALPNNGENTP